MGDFSQNCLTFSVYLNFLFTVVIKKKTKKDPKSDYCYFFGHDASSLSILETY